MKKSLITVMLLISVIMCSSCYGTKTQVGSYREIVKVEKTDTYNYSKGKQAYLFWGFLPLGRTQVATPMHGNCQVKTRMGFLDACVSLVTGGLFSMQTIKVRVPRVMSNVYSDATPLNEDANCIVDVAEFGGLVEE